MAKKKSNAAQRSSPKAKRAPKARQKPLADGCVKTMMDVSSHFDVSYYTVKTNWKAGGMPRQEDGSYHLATIAEWRALRIANQPHIKPMNGTPTTGNLDNDPVHQRRLTELRIKEEELKKRKRENEIAAGEFVPRHDVQVFFSTILARFRDDLSRIPGEMSSSYPTEIRNELEQQLENRLNLMLETIYRQRHKIDEIAAAKIRSSKAKTTAK